MEPEKQKTPQKHGQLDKEKKLNKVKLIKEMIQKAKDAKNNSNKGQKYFDEQQELINQIKIDQVQKVSKKPIQLNQKIQWSQINLSQQKDLAQFHQLIKNYLFQEQKGFHFQHSKQLLKWSLNPPGFQPKWLIGIRHKQYNKLIGTITAIPVTCFVQQTQIKMALINHLIVHPKIEENQKITAKLITQLSRRINLKNRWQAIYISDLNFKNPFTKSCWFIRPLNIKKLLQYNYIEYKKNHSLTMYNKIYSLPLQPTIQGLRNMNKKDVPGVTKLINEGLKKYVVRFYYSEEQIKHIFLNKNMNMHTYIRQKQLNDKKKRQITDIISFYPFPGRSSQQKTINACRCYINIGTSVQFKQLIKNALILAKNNQYDVYKCLNIMDNSSSFEDLFFMRENQKNQYKYFFHNLNLKSQSIKPQQLGVIF